MFNRLTLFYSSLDLCFLCLWLISLPSTSQLRISHISNQHQSLSRLSQVIRGSSSSSSLSSSLSYSSPLSSPLSSSNPSSSSTQSTILIATQSTSSSSISDNLNINNSNSKQNISNTQSFINKNTQESTSYNTNNNIKDSVHHNQHHGQRHLFDSVRLKSPSLKRFMLRNKSVTCNDGTKAGYYFRPSQGGSRRWIVFLEGGWYCFSELTCHQRWLGMRHLMTSAHWPQSRWVNGILSPEPGENPYFWNANHVFVPYCSSDSWSGDSPAATSADLSFLGSRIVLEVISELLTSKGLFHGRSLLLAGSSAGAGGVLVNLDRVSQFVADSGSKVEVRGLMDSGWFLDNQPFTFQSIYSDSLDETIVDSADLPSSSPTSSSLSFSSFSSSSPSLSPPSSSSSSSSTTTTTTTTTSSTQCTSAINCSPIESIKLGMKLWNGQVPEACRSLYPTEPWRCYFGYRLYPVLKSPLFVFQWIFDEAQMIADNVGAPISKAQWNYIHQMGQELRNSLSNVTALFAPSCISHIVLTKSTWTNIEINGTSLPQAIRCWEIHESLSRESFSNETPGTIQYSQTKPADRSTDLVADESQPNNSHHHHHHRNAFRFTSIPFSSGTSSGQTTYSSSLIPSTSRVCRKKSKRRHKKHKKRQQQRDGIFRSKRLATRQDALRLYSQRPRVGRNSNCQYHLIDSCSWPQCNSGCPKLHNPFTGEEVNFLELLKSYGFNLMAIAQALGMETKALTEMEDSDLLRLFHKKIS